MTKPAPSTALLTSDAAIGSWTLDPDRTQVQIRHKTFWGLATVQGTFGEVSGHGDISADHVVTGTITVGAASVDTRNSKRDAHLRSPAFFDVETHPDFVLDVQSATAAGEHLDLAAELTIKGVREPVTLTAEVTALDADKLAVHVTGIVDRHRFGISTNQLGMIKALSSLDVDAVFARTTT